MKLRCLVRLLHILKISFICDTSLDRLPNFDRLQTFAPPGQKLADPFLSGCNSGAIVWEFMENMDGMYHICRQYGRITTICTGWIKPYTTLNQWVQGSLTQPARAGESLVSHNFFGGSGSSCTTSEGRRVPGESQFVKGVQGSLALAARAGESLVSHNFFMGVQGSLTQPARVGESLILSRWNL